MSDRLWAGCLAAAFAGMLAWGLYFGRIGMRWRSYTWDEQPAQFVAVCAFRVLVAFVLLMQASGVTWIGFWKIATGN